MLRKIHSLPGLIAALLVAVLAVSGAILSLEPVIARTEAVAIDAGASSVAALAEAVTARHPEVDKIVRTASGAVIVYFFDDGLPGAEQVDPLTGAALAPHAPSRFMGFVTTLHRQLFLEDAGRAAAGLGALAMVVLTITGAMMLAARQGGWRNLLRPVRGTTRQRLHGAVGRFAAVGLLLSALTGCYMSLATFAVISDGVPEKTAVVAGVDGGPRVAAGTLAALKSVDLADLRELTFPYAADLTDVYTLTSATGIGHVDAATGALLDYAPHSPARQIYETIYMLHTGQGLWPLAILLGLSALAVPLLSMAGVMIWWARRAATPRIAGNVPAQQADMILLVGSEGNSTWGFAATLHAALNQAGHKVHTGAMNDLALSYANAQAMIILTATYGDGVAPASASRFLARLEGMTGRLPVAVLGFGDRSFPKFCRFAETVQAAFAAKATPTLLDLARIDRQSAQEFAGWGERLGRVLGMDLTLAHVPTRPRTTALRLVSRMDYGADVQAATAILRFALPGQVARAGFWNRLVRRLRQPGFEAGDLVGILPPGSDVPRFYSLASGERDGFLEICVRKQPGGLCSGLLHDLKPGDAVEGFIRANPAFRPARSSAPLILVGAGAGIGPLMGFIRQNSGKRPVHLYWGGRNPDSDFLYEHDLATCLADRRLTALSAVFSRVTGGRYVQSQIIEDSSLIEALMVQGAQVMVCGGRDMGASVARAFEAILKPSGLDLAMLRSNQRYLEDVY